jgi:hypothetical protein
MDCLFLFFIVIFAGCTGNNDRSSKSAGRNLSFTGLKTGRPGGPVGFLEELFAAVPTIDSEVLVHRLFSIGI